jgi:ubiquinone/menaquinone biosynthesis C-methylase UbiE
MLKMARGDFSYMYPLLAAQIIRDYGTKSGKCLDIGAGPGLWGIELAKKCDLDVVAMDLSPQMCKIAEKMAREHGVSEKIKAIHADVHEIPFEDNYFDLIISKGSLIFWDEPTEAFKEIYRVLKPGGVTFIGIGDGRLWPQDIKGIYKKIKFNIRVPLRNKFSPAWQKYHFDRAYWKNVMKEASIKNFRIVNHFMWMEIRKS